MQQTAIADGGGGEPSKTDMTAVKAFMQRVHKNPKPVAKTTLSLPCHHNVFLNVMAFQYKWELDTLISYFNG